jgi:superfamily II RNA helicase
VVQRKKVVYCSPIKALSNQKFYEFQQKYPHISFGLMTGDNKINAAADCLIMTTEILMNALFRGNAAYGRSNAAANRLMIPTGELSPSALGPSGPHEPPPVGLSENGFESVPETVLPNLDGTRSDSVVWKSDCGVQRSNLLEFSLDIESELAAVVLDEVHYINDAGRGHVWEQLIMLLPAHVQLIMLSATIDRPEEFAAWCEGPSGPEHCIDAIPNLSDKSLSESVKTPCSDKPLSKPLKQPDSDKPLSTKRRHVVLSSTSHRIVPLSHHVFLTHTEGHIKKTKDDGIKAFLRKNTNTLLTIQTAAGQWQPDTYTTCQKVLDIIDRADRPTGGRMSDSGRGQKASSPPPLSAKYVLNKLLGHLVEQEMVPALLFLFSRKQVEKVAADITTTLLPFDSKVPYIARREVEKVLRDKLDNWQEYVALPEYEFLVLLLEKGIGIHHAGMVPVFREIVELFISRRYIYLLIATESFAIGLDCPIKTTIFMGLTKWDGKANRMLLSHEYTQMAGRAGRRGIDTVGYVVHLPNLYALPPPIDYKGMLSGRPERFESKFAVSYGVVLALLQQGPKTVAEMVSFVEGSMAYTTFQKQVAAQKRRVEDIQQAYQEAHAALVQVDEARSYIDRRNWLTQVSPKKRKELEKEMADLVEQIPGLMAAVRQLDATIVLEMTAKEEETYLASLQGWVQGQVSLVCGLLVELGFVEFGESAALFRLTRAGTMAAGIKEVDGLVLAPLLLETDGFRGFTVEQVVGVLSCFLEMRSENDSTPPCKELPDPVLDRGFRRLLQAKEAKEAAEVARPGIEHIEETVLQTRLSTPLMEWCSGCRTGEECRALLQTQVAEVGLSLGDFVKAVLKVVAAKKELESIAVEQGWVELQHLLSQVDERMLKFIMTNQSLYL